MLSLRFLGARDLPRPSVNEKEEDETWSIQVQGGSSRCIHLDRGAEEGNQKGGVATAQVERSGDATISTLWPEEVEVDSEGKDTVEVALHCEPSTASSDRERNCHWVTTIEVEEFRLQPDRTFVLWKTLRPVMASGHTGTHDLGALQISITYAVDYVREGYWFALFCGLIPAQFIRHCTDITRPSSRDQPKATPIACYEGRRHAEGSGNSAHLSPTTSTAQEPSICTNCKKKHG